MSKALDSVVRNSTSTKPTADVNVQKGNNPGVSAAKAGTGARMNDSLVDGDKSKDGGKNVDVGKSGTGGTLEFGSLKKKAADRSIYT